MTISSARRFADCFSHRTQLVMRWFCQNGKIDDYVIAAKARVARAGNDWSRASGQFESLKDKHRRFCYRPCSIPAR
jgi:hypothetical protein